MYVKQKQLVAKAFIAPIEKQLVAKQGIASI